MSKEVMYFVRDAKTYREKSGTRVKAFEAESELSRSTIARIEGDAGVSRVSAFAYINTLKKYAPDYPHLEPYTAPKGAKVKIVTK